MNQSTKNTIATLTASIVILFLAPVIIRMGWNILAYQFNLPQFGYWEVFWIRWAVVALLKPIFGKGSKIISDED